MTLAMQVLWSCNLTPWAALLELAPLQRLHTLSLGPSGCGGTHSSSMPEVSAALVGILELGSNGCGLPALKRLKVFLPLASTDEGSVAVTAAWQPACDVARAMLALRGRAHVAIDVGPDT